MIPEKELDRVAGTLQSLEQTLHPLFDELPPSIDPAITFTAEPERGA